MLVNYIYGKKDSNIKQANLVGDEIKYAFVFYHIGLSDKRLVKSGQLQLDKIAVAIFILGSIFSFAYM